MSNLPYSPAQFMALPGYQTADPFKRKAGLDMLQQQWREHLRDEYDDPTDYDASMQQVESVMDKHRQEATQDAVAQMLRTGELMPDEAQRWITQGSAAVARSNPNAAMALGMLETQPYEILKEVPLKDNRGTPLATMTVRRDPQTAEVAYKVFNRDVEEGQTKAPHAYGIWKTDLTTEALQSRAAEWQGNADLARQMAQGQYGEDPALWNTEAASRQSTADRLTAAAKGDQNALAATLAEDFGAHAKATLSDKLDLQGFWEGLPGQALSGFLQVGQGAKSLVAMAMQDDAGMREAYTNSKLIREEIEGMSKAKFRPTFGDKITVGLAEELIPLALSAGTSWAMAGARSAATAGADALASGGLKSFLQGTAGKAIGTAPIESAAGKFIADRISNAAAFLPSSARSGLQQWGDTMDAASAARGRGDEAGARQLEERGMMNYWGGVGIETLTENLFINPVMATRAGRSMGNIATDVLERRLGAEGLQRLRQSAADMLTKGAVAGGQGGLEEVFAGIGGRAWGNAFAGQNKDLLEGLPEEFVIGALLEGTMASAASLRNTRPDMAGELLFRGLEKGDPDRMAELQTIFKKAGLSPEGFTREAVAASVLGNAEMSAEQPQGRPTPQESQADRPYRPYDGAFSPDAQAFEEPEQPGQMIPGPVVMAQATKYGYQADPYLDSNSAAGIGHNNNRLVAGQSVALMQTTAQKLGIRRGDSVRVQIGDQHFVAKYDDTIPPNYDEDRIDFYAPDGKSMPVPDGAQVALSRADGQQPSTNNQQPTLTRPTTSDPQGTIPETPPSLLAQRRRVMDGSKPAMLVPGTSTAEMPAELRPTADDGLVATDTPAGVVLHQLDLTRAEILEAVEKNTLNELLGYGPKNKSQVDPATAAAVVLRDAEGNELAGSLADAESLEAVKAALSAQAREGDTVEVAPPETVLNQRAGISTEIPVESSGMETQPPPVDKKPLFAGQGQVLTVADQYAEARQKRYDNLIAGMRNLTAPQIKAKIAAMRERGHKLPKRESHEAETLWKLAAKAENHFHLLLNPEEALKAENLDFAKQHGYYLPEQEQEQAPPTPVPKTRHAWRKTVMERGRKALTDAEVKALAKKSPRGREAAMVLKGETLLDDTERAAYNKATGRDVAKPRKKSFRRSLKVDVERFPVLYRVLNEGIAALPPEIRMLLAKSRKGTLQRDTLKFYRTQKEILNAHSGYERMPWQKDYAGSPRAQRAIAEMLQPGNSNRPDQMAAMFDGKHGITDPDSLWRAIETELNELDRPEASEASEQDAHDERMEAEGAQLMAFWTAVEEGKMRVDGEELVEGAVLNIEGEPTRVVKIERDEDTGDIARVILQDGRKFGRREVSGDAVLWVEDIAWPEQDDEAAEAAWAEVTPDGQQDFLAGQADEPFNLVGETNAERKAREAAEAREAAAKEAAAVAKAKQAAIDATPELGLFHSGLPPEMLTAPLRDAFRAARTLADFTTRALTKLGEWIRPHLTAIWNHLKAPMGEALEHFLIRIGAMQHIQEPGPDRVENVFNANITNPAPAPGYKINQFGQRVQADERLRESWRQNFQPREYQTWETADLMNRVKEWIANNGGLEGAANLFMSGEITGHEGIALGSQLILAYETRAMRMERKGDHTATAAAETMLDEVARRMETLLTGHGQALRAAQLYSKLSPRTVVRKAQREVLDARDKHAGENLGVEPGELLAAVNATPPSTPENPATAPTDPAEQEARETLQRNQAEDWIARLAKSQSDTLSWPTKKKNALNELIRAAMKSPVEDFIGKAIALGVNPENAARLEELTAEERRRNSGVERERQIAKLVESLKPKTRKAKEKVPQFIAAVMKAREVGALSRPEFMDLYAATFNLPRFTPEIIRDLKALADAVTAAPTGSWLRMKAQGDLMNYLSRWEGIPFGRIMQSAWYSNIMGPGTQVGNVVGGMTNLALHSAATTITNPKQFLDLLGGGWEGLKIGAAMGLDHVRHGTPVHKGEVELKWEGNDVLEALAITPNADLNMKRIITKYGYAMVGRYVMRMMNAADAAIFMTARESKAHVLAARGGVDPYQRDQEAAAEEQAREELQAANTPTTPRNVARRKLELLHQWRDAETQAEAMRYGAHVTLNYKPEGLFGALVDGVNGMKAGAFILTPFMPFVRILGNLAAQNVENMGYGVASGAMGENLFGKGGKWQRIMDPSKSPKGRQFGKDERKERVVRGLLGIGLTVGLYTLLGDDDRDDWNIPLMVYAMGPPTKNGRDQMPKGWRPFTVKIGGYYWNYADTPFAMVLGALGGALDRKRYGTRLDKNTMEQRLTDYAGSAAGAFFSAGVLSGLKSLTGFGSSQGGSVAGFAGRTVAGFIPQQATLREIAKIMDPDKVDTRTFYGALVQNIPVMRADGKPPLNVFGEPVREPGPWLISRIVTSQDKTDLDAKFLVENGMHVPDADNDMVRGKYLTKEEKAAVAQRIATAEPYLTPEELYKFHQQSGKDIRATVAQMRKVVAQLPPGKIPPKDLQKHLKNKTDEARRKAMINLIK